MTATNHKLREEVYESLRRLECGNAATVAKFLLHPGEDPDSTASRVRGVLRSMEAEGLVRRFSRRGFKVIRPDLGYSDAYILARMRDVVEDALSHGYTKSRIHNLVIEVSPRTFTMQHLVGLPKEEVEEWREEVQG